MNDRYDHYENLLMDELIRHLPKTDRFSLMEIANAELIRIATGKSRFKDKYVRATSLTERDLKRLARHLLGL